MPFTIRPFRRFPVQCAVTYNVGSFEWQQDTIGNLPFLVPPWMSEDSSNER
jgi:hypothetical protein